MPLFNMREMLQHAYDNHYAIGAFDLVDNAFLEAIMAGVETCQAPVILSLAESHFSAYDFATLMPAVVSAARRSPVPVAIHLDHGASLESAVAGIRLGCNGVMVDASEYPYEENVSRSRAVVEMAHACGICVEGELGYVAGQEGEDAEHHPGEIIYTPVEQAEDYVRSTGVDCLAVSIGTVHGHFRGEPQLDMERLQAINKAINIPIVIHGGTGLSDDQFRALIARGVAKINYYTALSDAAAASIREQSNRSGGYTHLLAGVRDAIRQEVIRCCQLWGAAGQADAVRAHCPPWQEVEHVILFNTEGLSDEQAADMMREGQRILSTLPGVRRVVTGNAVQADASYRYCWVIRFAHPAVIDSYRVHPEHQAFADKRFRPYAGGRVSIDYQET
jgi:fructose-bisphosphate aldolase class II